MSKDRYMTPLAETVTFEGENAILGLSDGNPITTPTDSGILPEPVLPNIGLDRPI